MSVLFETSLGDLVFDLEVERCPLASRNFLKLCKMKFYNNALFYSIEKNFIAQCGDGPKRDGGGCAAWQLERPKKGEKEPEKQAVDNNNRWFRDEINVGVKKLQHTRRGRLGMASEAAHQNGSKFYITLGEKLPYLDGKHTVCIL
jgi:peptidyl-prolyl cis-trans isomerase-like 4